MKKIIFFLTIILLISCKKELDKSKPNEIKNSNNKESKFVSYGDSLISKSNFVNDIQRSTDIKHQRVALSKIQFDYDKFIRWNLNTVEEKSLGSITLKFEKEKKQNLDADIYTHINLSIYKNNKISDKIIIYKQENYSEALVSINKFFYIDSDLNIWTLEINEDEDGIKVIFWNHYKIDKLNGEIRLIKSNKFIDEPIKNTNKDDHWNGKYFFEKSNRDDLKTSFQITINNLNDIFIVYVSDGEMPETYKNVVGQKITDDKIKIVFNKNYDDMGTIFIEIYEKEYIISGIPISNINPGNDQYAIKKTNTIKD